MAGEADFGRTADVATLRTLLGYKEGGAGPPTRDRQGGANWTPWHAPGRVLAVPGGEEGPSHLHVVPSRISRPQELMEHPRRGGGQCVGGVSSRLRKLEATEFYPRYSRWVLEKPRLPRVRTISFTGSS